MRIRACGSYGTDAGHIARGGLPFGPGGGLVPAYLGHDPAGEVAEVGGNVRGLAVGYGLVVNPMTSRGSLMGIPAGAHTRRRREGDRDLRACQG